MGKIGLENPFVLVSMGQTVLQEQISRRVLGNECKGLFLVHIVPHEGQVPLCRVTTFCAAAERARLFRSYDVASQGLASRLPQHGKGERGRPTPTLKCLKPEVKSVTSTHSSLARMSHMAPSKPQKKQERKVCLPL